MKDNNTKTPDDFGENITGWHNLLGWGNGEESVAPYVPTPNNVVRTMLELAEAGPDDVVYDLGCGDGRILIMAVEEFDVNKAVGFELNRHLVETTISNVASKNLEQKILVERGNFFEVDLSSATIVTLYLTTTGNSKLRQKFIDELRDGTRIISHDFPIQDWITMEPNNTAIKFGSHKIFCYKIPDAYKTKTDETDKTNDKRWEKIKELLNRL